MTIGDKLKEKVKGTKDKVVGTAEDVAEEDEVYEEGAPGTERGRKDDPLTEYREKEPMTPAKIKEHEPTAVKRDANDQRIVEPGQQGSDPEKAKEIARRSGMAKGTAGAAETGDEYEQGAAGTNK
jgi:hypothetical protein